MSSAAAVRDGKRRPLEYREDLLKILYIGVPSAVLTGLAQLVSTAILAQPWQGLLLLVPIALVGWLILRGIIERRDLALDWRYLVFIGVYVCFFSLAAQVKLLDWERDPTVFGQSTRGSWLAPVWWGDWRYSFVPTVRGGEVIVVLREPTTGKTAEQARTELIDLVGWAASSGSRGVVLDYYFDQESQVDSTLCAVIAATDVQVLFGYGIEPFLGQLQALPVPSSLQSCVTDQNSAHLVGLRDADKKTRLLPLFFNGRQDRPALSLLAARTLARDAELPLPANGQLRFIEPTEPHLQVSFADLRTNSAARNALKDRLVLMGEESDLDSFNTPFGKKPGAVVHADAVHSLTHSHYFRDVPWWVSFLLIFASCYGFAAWCAGGAPARMLVIASALASGSFAAMAAVAAVTGPYWFDAFYPSAAIWLLLPLLLGLRRLLRPSARGQAGLRESLQESPLEPSSAQIFISFASEDRELADQIHLALIGAGHRVFFDRESLLPAGDYHEEIQHAVEASDVFVFLVSVNSLAAGSYALTELKYARKKWEHPANHVLPVMVGPVDWNALPPYLKAVTVLEPEGNTPAEVRQAVQGLVGEKANDRFADD